MKNVFKLRSKIILGTFKKLITVKHKNYFNCNYISIYLTILNILEQNRKHGVFLC